jgi:hypothetical protein
MWGEALIFRGEVLMHEVFSRALPRVRTTVGKSLRISFCLLGTLLLGLSACAFQSDATAMGRPNGANFPSPAAKAENARVSVTPVKTGAFDVRVTSLHFSITLSPWSGSAPPGTLRPGESSRRAFTFRPPSASQHVAEPVLTLGADFNASSPPSGTNDDPGVINRATASQYSTIQSSPTPIPPTIIFNPNNQTVMAGQPATFYVVVSGDAPMSYQWLINGAPVGGTNSPTFTIPTTIAANSGATFAVIVSNDAGSVASTTATLTVNSGGVAPTIVFNPANQIVIAGQPATFYVVATSETPLSYQWLMNGAPLGGATSSPSFTIPTTIAANSGATFAVIVSNDAGSVTSTTVTLTVNSGGGAPTITSNPTNQTVTAGQPATFYVAATGDAPLSYQWLINGAPVGGVTSSPSFTIPTTITANSGATFAVIVSNNAGSVTSGAALLTVNPSGGAPTITSNPASQTVIAGQSVTFSVAATGAAPLSYQWLMNGAPVSGSSSPSFFIPTTVAANSGATFAVIVSNNAGSVTSGSATLIVNSAGGMLTASPSSLGFGGLTVGGSLIQTLTVTNTGTASVTISNVIVSGAGFTPSGLASGEILAPGGSTSMLVTFLPLLSLNVTGSVTITSNANNSPLTISLSSGGTQGGPAPVTLSWTPSVSPGVVGYNVYRATSSGAEQQSSPINGAALIAGDSYADTNVASGTTYYYVVTAVNSSGIESAPSAETSTSVP